MVEKRGAYDHFESGEGNKGQTPTSQHVLTLCSSGIADSRGPIFFPRKVEMVNALATPKVIARKPKRDNMPRIV